MSALDGFPFRVWCVAVIPWLLLGCSDGRAMSPTELEAGSLLTSEQGDYLAWDGNVLEFIDDDGVAHRWVRDQEAARRVTLYQNGVLQGDVYLVREGTEVTQIRWVAPVTEEWILTTNEDNPQYIDDSSKRPCPPEGCIQPESVPDECIDENGDFLMASCSLEGFAISAGTVLGAGFVAFVSWRAGMKDIAKRAAITAGLAASAAIHQARDYVRCQQQ